MWGQDQAQLLPFAYLLKRFVQQQLALGPYAASHDTEAPSNK